ncbi:MAG: RHS repeat-associated core domain-containing protein, partial [Anaerolineales bacterium]|nr:RHS repeat-associated core domain-containing protein [Anaerolineales bacterium]
MQTNIGSTTTYFVGNYYQVENGLVTKYYYAGSQRVAMRKNGTLNFILGDHLGSTSLVTDANGTVINETKYKAWGEARYSSGAEQTKYTYTGQYSYVSDFGLHFYNARWYDSSLGRFAQADSIMPGGIQGYDRYAYVNNNPIRYTDPSGHRCAGDGDEDINGHCIVSGGMTTTTSTPSVTTAPVLTS